MAAAFAERECRRRGLDDVEIRTGGTHPADAVHDTIVEVMAEDGIDVAERTPREISIEEIETFDYVATVGCSTLDISDASDVEIHDWALDDPHGKEIETVRAIREDIERRIGELFEDAIHEIER